MNAVSCPIGLSRTPGQPRLGQLVVARAWKYDGTPHWVVPGYLLGSDEYWDPHAIAGLLKTFLRELPASILTRELHLRFLAVIGESSERAFTPDPIYFFTIHRF